MSTPSQPQRTATPRARLTDGGFLRAWRELMGTAAVPTIPRRRGRRPRVPLDDLLPALTYHVVQGVGTLAGHFLQLFGTTLADSSWSDRRQRLPWEIFTELMRRVLRPRATRAQAGAFWRDWRLVALDGTQFSLTNTAQVRATRPKARSRRGRARMLIKPQVLRRLRDGSRLIRVPVRDPTHPNRIVEWLEVREIPVRVGRPGHRAHLLRL